MAIACAAIAVEAEVSWVAILRDRSWLDSHERMPTPQKWAAWIYDHTGRTDLGLGSALGQRVASLFNDRDIIVHFRGVPIPGARKRDREIHQPPDVANSGITAVRAYLTTDRARTHVATAEQAIAELNKPASD